MKKSLLIIFGFLVLSYLGRGSAMANYTPGSSAKLKSEVVKSETDHRAQILESYLKDIDSPLAPHAGKFVETADKYNLDWKLVVSIAGLESGYGKHQPTGSYNGWGWGYNNGSVKYFVSWDEAIEEISRGLRQGYLKEIEESDPYIIGPTYAASPTWAVRVAYFMDKLEGYRTRNATSTLTLAL